MAIRETVRVTSSDELKDIIEKEYEAHKTAAIIDLNFIDVSNLTKLRLPLLHKFNGYLDISNWDVSNVVSMEGLFALANFSTDLSKCDVSNVECMNRMFNRLKGRISGLRNWNVSKVKDMSYMFKNAEFVPDEIADWDLSNVNDMKGMFKGATFGGDISNWDVCNVRTMASMFEDCKGFLEENKLKSVELSKWNVSRVVDFSRMFKNANSDFDVSKWKIDSAVNFFDTGLDCNEGFDFIKEQLNQKKTIDLNETDELEKLKGYVLIG